VRVAGAVPAHWEAGEFSLDRGRCAAYMAARPVNDDLAMRDLWQMPHRSKGGARWKGSHDVGVHRIEPVVLGGGS